MNNRLKDDLKTKVILASNNLQKIVDAPFSFIEVVMLELGVVVLLIENTETKTIDRLALSRTEPAAGAVQASKKPFNEIRIPLSEKTNAIVKALQTKKAQIVTDWKYLFIPELTAQEARDNQHGAGILCSVVSPLKNSDRRGAIIFSFLCPEGDLSDDHYRFIDDFTEIVSGTI